MLYYLVFLVAMLGQCFIFFTVYLSCYRGFQLSVENHFVPSRKIFTTIATNLTI